jgi:mycofactocin glycosyltransferase
MIPLEYTLREGIRVQEQGDRGLVISDVPLNVVSVSKGAAQILQSCNGGRSINELATGRNGFTEENVFQVCEYFRKRAMLEVSPSGPFDYCPTVSVIIPSRDRRADLLECLEAVHDLGYPRDKVEVIVVDDGSCDGTVDAIKALHCKVLSNSRPRGQSFCRNEGASAARGEILAFIDSDCIPDRAWLKDLVSFFCWDSVGAVGGYVDGYFREASLDRYEKSCSSLNMGRYFLWGGRDDSTMYVPTCNLLVRSTTYGVAGGIREEMLVGEDVDLCWRIREAGQKVIYVPSGVVKHKHRSKLARMLFRKAQYGTSEALLHKLHPEKRKVFQVPPLALSAFAFLVLAILIPSAAVLLGTLGSVFLDAVLKAYRILRLNSRIVWWKIIYSVVRSHFAFAYTASFHLVRYYLLLFLLICLFHPPLILFVICILLLSAVCDYHLKKPDLAFLPFLCYYTLEHMSYQIGVFVGCLKEKTFMSYIPRFFRRVRQNFPG